MRWVVLQSLDKSVKSGRFSKKGGKCKIFYKTRTSERSSALSKDLEGLMSDWLPLVALQCLGDRSERACPKAGDSHKH